MSAIKPPSSASPVLKKPTAIKPPTSSSRVVTSPQVVKPASLSSSSAPKSESKESKEVQFSPVASPVYDDLDTSTEDSQDPVWRSTENVTVVVRVRPMNSMEKRSGQSEAWLIKDHQYITQTYFANENQVSATGAPRLQSGQNKAISFAFDHIFTEENGNEYVYQSIGDPLVEKAMMGFHACVFAYGQTSSGKTHTIHGTANSPGFISQSLHTVFDFIERCTEREFVLRVSYLEIYNEIINDLLNPRNVNLSVREDKKKGVFVEGLTEDVVVSSDQVFSLLAAGEAHRHVGATNYNEQSSRSHTIFRLTIESTSRNASSKGVRASSLNLVDLAGSENAVKAGSASRIKETGYINKSLLTLGHVIYKLSDTSPTAHIPYRDSKLTRILQTPLSGSAVVCVVCCCSPASANVDETISTLKFANRAKKIKNNASVNEVFDESSLLRQYREEIAKLKEELQKAREQYQTVTSDAASKVSGPDKQIIALTKKQQQEIQRQLQESGIDLDKQHSMLAQIEHLTRLILTSSQNAAADEKLLEDEEQKLADETAEPLLSPRSLSPSTQESISSSSTSVSSISVPTSSSVADVPSPYHGNNARKTLRREKSRYATLRQPYFQTVSMVQPALQAMEASRSATASPLLTSPGQSSRVIIPPKEAFENSEKEAEKLRELLTKLSGRLADLEANEQNALIENQALKTQVSILEQQVTDTDSFVTVQKNRILALEQRLRDAESEIVSLKSQSGNPQPEDDEEEGLI